MDTEGYLQLIMSTFIVIVLILVFILYVQGSRTNVNRRVIVGPGGQQWVNTRPVIVTPVVPSQQLLGPGGTQWVLN